MHKQQAEHSSHTIPDRFDTDQATEMCIIEKKLHLSIQKYGISLKTSIDQLCVSATCNCNMPERNLDKGFAVKKTKCEKI